MLRIENRTKFRLALLLIIVPCLLGSAWYAGAHNSSAIDERVNVAASENGGVATASSTKDDENYPPSSVINGDRRGIGWGNGGGWSDNTPGSFPDTIEVEFSNVMSIDEVDVFTLQDAWWNPIEPTESTVFNNNGITAFTVQYFDGDNWLTVPGGTVTGNNKVWRKFTFSPVSAERIRVVVNAGPVNSNVVELEAWGVTAQPNPTPTPTPGGTPPPDNITDALSQHDIFIDSTNNVGFGTQNPIFNDDGTTGAFVGKWVAIDGKLTGASAYLGLGGTIPGPGQRVGVLNFYNRAMGGADNRTAAIFSFNGATLGTGNLEFYTSPNFIGPVRRMQISPTGEIGINHAASVGTMFSVMSKTADATTKGLVVLDGTDRPTLTVRGDGQVSVDKPGQGVVLKSPNGLICRKLTIDNSGNLVVANMPSCP